MTGRHHSGTDVSQNAVELVNIRAESQLAMLCKGSTPQTISSLSRKWDALDRRSAGCARISPLMGISLQPECEFR